ncbi:MAG: hypothetical protein ISR64_02730 [Deltaproteobacteria bacterium]|nr:hypothetical protein [Deltaproteobacteria bacterium]
MIFPFHHPLMPLTDERVLAMKLKPVVASNEGCCAVIGPFGDLVAKVDFVFRHEDGTWDNNDGAETVTP